MKLSNKILIGFFSILFLYLTAAFTEIRLRGSSNILDDNNSKAETVDIANVNYLVLPDLDQVIQVIGSDQPRLEVRSISGDLLHKLQYNVSGDTLTLTELNLEENERVRITIYVPRNNLTGITTNGSWVDIQGLEQKELSIIQNQGHISMEADNQISKLTIKASDKAALRMSGTALDLLSVELDNSRVVSNSPIKLLEGSMTNDSYINLVEALEIQLKKDNSCSIKIN